MITSEFDRREYRVVELENGLQALLIRGSDASTAETSPATASKTRKESLTASQLLKSVEVSRPSESSSEADASQGPGSANEKMAAASLTVRCGSINDPKDIGGVAHYLEHMLFLGSKKYPKENEYMKYISLHGGTYNAYTSLDVTSFYFEVPQTAFRTALDMFANFFVSPLLRESSLDKEVQAVDNEFQINRQYDGARVMEILLRQAGNHPIGKFSWGNLVSLKEDPEKRNTNMHDVLEEFFNSYYSADCMTLAVQWQGSLDELESLVREAFSAITVKERPKLELPTELPFIDNEDFFKLFKIVPVNRRITLALRWILPTQRKFYHEKTFRYLRYIIGNEATDGLLDTLRTKQWALDLGTTVWEDHDVCAVFAIELNLTETGVESLAEVLRYVHQYLHMLRHRGPQKWIWDELRSIAEANFRFKTEEPAYSYVGGLSEAMQFSAREHLLCADELFFEFNPDRVRALLAAMTPDRCNITYMHHIFQKNATIFTRREPFMGTLYEIEDFPKSWVRLWEDEPKFHQTLKLPQENVYISTDFRLKGQKDVSPSPFPIMIDDGTDHRLWFRRDDKFLRPYLLANFHFVTSRIISSAMDSACTGMLIEIFRLLIAREATYAEEASLCHSLGEAELGLVLNFWGFNHKLPLLIGTVFKLLASISCSDELFRTVKRNRLKHYYNAVIDNANFAEDLWSFIVQPRNRPCYQKHAALKNMTREDFIDWARHIFGSAYVETYVHGNAVAADAKDILGKVHDAFRHCCPKQRPAALAHARIEGQIGVRVLGLNREAPASYITNHYIYGPAHFYEESMIALLVMYLEEKCFSTLRTEEQLGYDVSCYVRTSYRVVGFSINISPPADKFTLSDVDRKIEDFLDQMAGDVQEMSGDEFDVLRQSLIKQKSCVDLSMEEEASRNWAEITDFRYIFDKLRLEINFLEKLTPARFRTWALRVIGEKRERRSKLSVQVVGHGKVALEECDGGAEIFKRLESADQPEQDIRKMPPVRCLRPLKGLPNQSYVSSLEDFVASLKFYQPVICMDPSARLDF